MLRIHLFNIFTNKTPQCLPLNCEDTDKCTLLPKVSKHRTKFNALIIPSAVMFSIVNRTLIVYPHFNYKRMSSQVGYSQQVNCLMEIGCLKE